MTPSRVEAIDVFRGIAILLVVLFHYTSRLPNYAINVTEGAPWPVFYGWVGVYFFFIISGYCIFMTLERSATVGIFLARRFSRIYPAFVAAVLLLFVFGVVSNVPSVPEVDFNATPPGAFDVVLNLLFVGELGEWVDGAFWSIAVEVKFYVLIAVMAAVITDAQRLAKVFTILAMVMGPIWAVSMAFSLNSTSSITPQALLKFVAIAPFLSFFAVGILGRQVQMGHKEMRGLLIVNVALSTALMWIQALPTDGINAVMIATVSATVYLGLALLFVAFISGWSIPHVPGVSSAIARVGFLSFSWYLIHENVGLSFLATLNLYLPAWISLVLSIASTFFIAVVFSSLFEHRFRKPVERVAMRLLDWLGSHVRGLSALRTTPPIAPAQ